MNKSGKMIFKLAVSITAIIFGLYMTFFHDNSLQGKEDSDAVESRAEMLEDTEKMKMGQNGLDYSHTELPMEDNESEFELYGSGTQNIEIYFSNTQVLDSGNMPLEAQAVLTGEVQTYLIHSGYADVTELYIDDESYSESEEKISFDCYMDGYEEMLQIEYWFQNQTLKYYITQK